jgi:hypothetical protein
MGQEADVGRRALVVGLRSSVFGRRQKLHHREPEELTAATQQIRQFEGEIKDDEQSSVVGRRALVVGLRSPAKAKPQRARKSTKDTTGTAL